MIDIHRLKKGAVLAALYNGSRPQGMGFMHYDPTPMTEEEGAKLLEQFGTYWDYLKGRVLKIELKDDEFDPRWYDRDNGEGAAQRIIDELKNSGQTITPEIQDIHRAGKAVAAADARRGMEEPTTFEAGPVSRITLGLKDVKDKLAPKVDQATKED